MGLTYVPTPPPAFPFGEGVGVSKLISAKFYKFAILYMPAIIVFCAQLNRNFTDHRIAPSRFSVLALILMGRI